MLQLVIGRSGSGKTHWILERMAQCLHQGQENLFWLVPEQHSFACERALLQRLGPVEAARVQVLSFSRLADRVFRQVGGVAGQPLDEGMRALLMSQALEQVAAASADHGDPLHGLRPGLVTDSAYVEQLLTLWEELRRCAVTTARLEQVAGELAQAEETASLLTEKTEDLYRVFTAYEGLVQRVGLREADDLTRLAQVLPDSTLLTEAAVFVDGFKGFTQQELAVLDRLFPRVSELTVALCTDTPGRGWPGTTPAHCRREYPLFSPVTATIQRLNRLAQNHGMEWELVELTENHRAKTPALKALEAGLYAPAPTVYEGDAAEVTLVPCASVYEECRYAVRRIRRLLRQGYRCREIAVATRRLEDYQGILDDMLACEGIPCYMDTRRDLLCEPLVVYLRSALRLAVDGWHTEEMLRLMKTDLWPLSPVEIAEMENYVYTWRIEGAAWEREWTENPEGIDTKITAAAREQLRRLNHYRQALMESLRPLRDALRGGATGRQFATAVYRWLSGQKELPGRMARQVQVLEEIAQPVLAAHAARLWEEIMQILDRFAVALGDQRLSATRLEELFTMLCRTIDVGTIPQGLDAVQVGSVERMRFNAPRAVLVLGANEGVFPAYPLGGGLLTEEERCRLKERGLTLAEDLLTQCVEERYYAYLALTAASEQLTVTYQTAAQTGPSPVVTAIQKILPGHTADVDNRPDGTDLESAEEMFRRLAHSYGAPSPVSETLRQVLQDAPEQHRRLAAVERAATVGTAYRMEEKETARALFGGDMCLSATQADTFYTCPFKYFCQYGLRLQRRQVAEIDGRVFGTLVHYAMEVLLPEYCQKGGLVERLRAEETSLNPDRELMEQLRSDVARVTEAYVNRVMGGFADKNGRFLYQLDMARRSAANVLWHTLVELQQGAFNPVDFELNIHPEETPEAEGVVSLRFPLKDGSVQVRGKVDRVDLFLRFDGTVFVRVVDYKTGTTKFELSELAEGQSIQMLLYLFILCESNRYADRGAQLRPAGVLYHPVTDLVVARGKPTEKRLERMKMSGVVLADPAVVLAMDRDTGGTFIPAKLDKGGKPVGNVATSAQFELLRRMVERLLVGMGEKLLDGQIEAVPIKRDQQEHCAYCAYRAICGREPEDRVRELKKKAFAAAMKDLEEEVTADE